MRRLSSICPSISARSIGETYIHHIDNFLPKSVARAGPTSRRRTTSETRNANSQQVAFKIRIYCPSEQLRGSFVSFLLLPFSTRVASAALRETLPRQIAEYSRLIRAIQTRARPRFRPSARPLDYPWNSLWIHSGVVRRTDLAASVMPQRSFGCLDNW